MRNDINDVREFSQFPTVLPKKDKMPKSRTSRTGGPKILKKALMSPSNRVTTSKQAVKRDKENTLNIGSDTESSSLVSDKDPILSFMKVEGDDLDEHPPLGFDHEISLPLKIEKYEALDVKEESLSDEEQFAVMAPYTGSNKDLNILIEWALNLQHDHSQKCTGRLYPCKEIYDTFSCKIVVLYCTVCKKRMLHTLKDWTMV